MLRFRNRFTAKPVESRVCGCGRLVTREVSDGRETIIHEHPWCDRFRELIAAIDAAGEAEGGNVSHHVALMAAIPDRSAVVRTVVVADGDSADECERVRF
jgi:hypothetical protein